MNKLKIFVILAVTALLVFACTDSSPVANTSDNSNTEAASAASPTPADDIAEGKKHYAENCARCHKEDGTGGKIEIEGQEINAEDLTTDSMIKEPDEEYLEYIAEGIPDEGMPAFKDVLNETQQKQVVKYIRKELQKQ